MRRGKGEKRERERAHKNSTPTINDNRSRGWLWSEKECYCCCCFSEGRLKRPLSEWKSCFRVAFFFLFATTVICQICREIWAWRVIFIVMWMCGKYLMRMGRCQRERLTGIIVIGGVIMLEDMLTDGARREISPRFCGKWGMEGLERMLCSELIFVLDAVTNLGRCRCL